MSKENQILTNQKFYGGNASDDAVGTPASFGYSRAINHRKSPSQLSVLPGPRKISAAVVKDLILNMVQVRDGTRYAYGKDGHVYKIDTSNAVTEIDTDPAVTGTTPLPTGSDGLLYREDSDAVYLATQTDIRQYSPISGTPAFSTIGASKSIDPKAYRTGGTTTYGVSTTMTPETVQGRATFQPDIEPFYSIKVFIVDKGTGNWTLELHDGLDQVLATVTVPNANLTAGQLNEFKFPTQIRGLVKPNARTYHYHLKTSTGTGSVQTATAGDLNTSDFELWAYRLVDPVNDLHPIAQFLQYTLIGNGNYLAVWEPLSPSNPPNAEFNRHRLTFPSGFEVCGIAVTDEFVAIATEKRSTNASKDYQAGKIFIWDGFGTTYNQIVDVSGGSPESIQSHENYPYFYVNGTLCAWPGGKNIVKVRKIAETDLEYSGVVDQTRAYPNMMTIRDNLLHAAYPSVTNNVAIEYGVHTWGTLEKNYPATWGNLNYAISTQRVLNDNPVTTPLELGMVKNFGDEMYISWRDGANYGLDIVDGFCMPAPIAKWRDRRFDAGATYKLKVAERTKISTKALPLGVTLTPVIKIDDNAEVSLSEFTIGIGATKTIAAIPTDKKNFEQIITGFDIACDLTTIESPVVKANTLAWNPQADKKDF
jgi:hypothetical protein